MAVSSDEDENGGYDREGKMGTEEEIEGVKVNQGRKVTNGETQEKFHGESEASLKDKGDGERKEKWKHVPCRNIVNYFFTNFPPEWNQANLRDIFAEFGEVVDVYVARKMSKVGLRFGFARFLRIGNPKVLERCLNQIWSGRLKLRENVAKYERQTSKFRIGRKNNMPVSSNPSELNQKPELNLTQCLQKAPIGESIFIHSLSELQSICGHSFDVSECNVKLLGDFRILLEFRNKEGKYHSTTDCRESERDVEVGEEAGNTSDLESSSTEPIVENGFERNSGEVKVQFSSNDISGDDLKNGDSVDLKKRASVYVACGSVSEDIVQKREEECNIDNVTSLSRARASREFAAKKAGPHLGGPGNSNSVDKTYGLCNIDIMNGTCTLQIQASNRVDFLIKRKIRTLNLFELVSKSKKSLSVINEMKKVSPRLRSAEALKFLRQLAF